MQSHVNGRLSLRAPQAGSLARLAQALAIALERLLNPWMNQRQLKQP